MRGFKHPFNVDTFKTIEAAREAYPHVDPSRFVPVELGDMFNHPTLGVIRESKPVQAKVIKTLVVTMVIEVEMSDQDALVSDPYEVADAIGGPVASQCYFTPAEVGTRPEDRRYMRNRGYNIVNALWRGVRAAPVET